MHGGRHAWQGGMGGRGACVAGKTAIAAGGTHPTGMHSCLLQYFYMKVARAWVTVTLTSYGSP